METLLQRSVQRIAVMFGASGGHQEPNNKARVVRDRNDGSNVTEVILRIGSSGGVVTKVDKARFEE